MYFSFFLSPAPFLSLVVSCVLTIDLSLSLSLSLSHLMFFCKKVCSVAEAQCYDCVGKPFQWELEFSSGANYP